MSNNKKSQHIAAGIKAINSRLSELAEPIAMLEQECTTLQERIHVLRAGIASRDWTLTGTRPKNCRESNNEAHEMRSQLYADNRNTETRLHVLQAELALLTRERAEFRNELWRLNQAAVTPELLQSEIENHEAELLDARSNRSSLVAALRETAKLRDQAENAERDELSAIERFNAAQKDSFLTSPDAPTTVTMMVTDAKVAMTLARERAAAARAARPTILARFEDATAALKSLDDRVVAIQAITEKKRGQQRKLIAHDEWEKIMEQIRVATRNLLDADPTAGRELANALAYEGLRAFDRDGRLFRPVWLNRGSKGFDDVVARAKL